MEKDIAEGKIGDVGSYDLEFKGGKLICKVGLSSEPGHVVSAVAGVSIELDAARVLDALKNAIPGSLDDAVIDLAKKGLGV